MDTSEQYIKMCDCREIRDLTNKIIETDHKRRVETSRRFRGTQYSVRIPDIRTPDVGIYDENNNCLRKVDLLSQGQIQEMVKEYYSRKVGDKRPHDKWFPEGYVGLGYVLKEFMKFASPFKVERLKSFEQLWLGFYMWESQQKVWANGKWIK